MDYWRKTGEAIIFIFSLIVLILPSWKDFLASLYGDLIR